VANAFNKFFITTSEKLNRYKSEKRDALSFLKDSFPGKFPTYLLTYSTVQSP